MKNTARAVNWIVPKMRAHPIVSLAIAGALVYLVILFGPAVALGIRDAFTNRTVEKQKAAAATEKTAAEQEKISAGQFETQRKAEDLNRDQSLQPERERRAATLQEATRRRRLAEERYEKNRQSRPDPDANDLDLRRRNCSDLAELYPGRRFAGCQ